MRALFAGEEGGNKTILRGGDYSMEVKLLNDVGTEIDITGDTLDVILYDTTDRRNAAVASFLALTHLVEPAGNATLPIGHVASAALPAGKTLYGFIKRTHSAKISFCNTPTIFQIS